MSFKPIAPPKPPPPSAGSHQAAHPLHLQNPWHCTNPPPKLLRVQAVQVSTPSPVPDLRFGVDLEDSKQLQSFPGLTVSAPRCNVHPTEGV